MIFHQSNQSFIPKLLLGAALLLVMPGCAFFRGIPSHGGGKRFDEEQRVVAGAIRQMIQEMSIAELQSRKVRLSLISMPTSGSGNISFGGLDWIGYSQDLEELERERCMFDYGGGGGVPAWIRELYEEREGWGLDLRYSPKQNFYVQRVRTDDDVAYLTHALHMKARHRGIELVGKKADAVLYVLIDVLGTNRSRMDRIFVKTDNLFATCECTYYAVDLEKEELLFSARRAAGKAMYKEQRVWPLGLNWVKRSSQEMEPTPFPTFRRSEKLPGAQTTPETEGQREEQGPERTESEHLEKLVSQARTQLKSGNREAARDALIQIIAIDPSHPDLQQLVNEYNLKFSE